MASNARKLEHFNERQGLGLNQKKEPRFGKSNKEKALDKIKEVCGEEYVSQLKEGKQHTAKSLYDGINQHNMNIYRQMGITDIEILAKIQEGIDGQSGKLKGKFDKAFKFGVNTSNKLVSGKAEEKVKNKILSDIRNSVEKKYLSAKLEGKTLSVEELYSLQKESWSKKSNLNMMDMYKKMGITEGEYLQTIQQAIDNLK